MGQTSMHRVPSPSQTPVVPTPSVAVVELVLSGDLDMERAGEMQRHLAGAVECGRDVVIDLSEVQLIDCMCLGVLLRAARTSHAQDRTFNLASPSKLVRMTLRATRTDDLFSILDDRPAAAPLGARPGADRRAG